MDAAERLEKVYRRLREKAEKSPQLSVTPINGERQNALQPVKNGDSYKDWEDPERLEHLIR